MSDQPQLLSRSISAAKWNYLGNGSRVLLQFAIGVVLARLLGPEAFGLVAIAWLMIGIGKLFSDFGFSAALIQRSNLTDQDVGFIFTVQVSIGAALSIACYLMAGEIGAFFKRPDAAPIIEIMACLFLIQAIGQTTTAALNRSLRFRFCQVVSVVTYLIGYVLVGIPTAYLGYGVWSLVAAQMSQAISYTAIVLIQSGISIKPALQPSRPGLFKFGSKVIGANLCSWGISNLDSVLIGRYLGITELGLYNRTMTLVSTPMNAATTSLQAVLFSAVVHVQADKKKVTEAFLATTELLAYICLPIFLVIAVIPDEVVLGVYGEKWSGAAILIVPLALAMPVNALLAIIGPILMAIDKTEIEIKAQAITLAAMLPALFVSSHISMTAVAWTILGIYFLRWMLLFRGVSGVLPLGGKLLFNTLKYPALLATMVSAMVWGVNQLLPKMAAPGKLGVLLVVSCIALLLLARMLGPALLSGPLGRLVRARRIQPNVATRWIRLQASDK